MRRSGQFIITLLIFLGSKSISAQKNYSIEQYTGDNGLPQNSVKGITADGAGFIWLATEDGLVRFDGRRFYTFNRFNLKISRNRFYMITPPLLPAKSLSGAVGKDKEVFYSAVNANEYVRIHKGTAVVDPQYNAGTASIPFLKDGHVKTFIASGLPYYLGELAIPKHYIIPVDESQYYICDSLKVVHYQDGIAKSSNVFAGRFWNYFTLRKKLYYLVNEQSVKSIEGNITTNISLSGDILKDISYGKKKSKLFWNVASDQAFLYLGKNLYMIIPNKKHGLDTRLIVEDFDLSSRNIFSIHLDSVSEKVFLGSVTQGLFILTKQLFQALATKEQELKNVFYAQIPFGTNAVLTPTGTVIGRDSATGQVFSRNLPVIAKNNTFDKYSLLRDTQGYIWIKSGNYLFRMDSKGEKLIGKWNLGGEIREIFYSKSKEIWAIVIKRGLYKINRRTRQPERILADRNITYLQSESAGRMILGTTAGVYVMNGYSGNLTLLKGTEGVDVKSIYVRAGGQIWIAARDVGIMLISGNEKAFRFPLDREKFLASAHDIIDDGRDGFWIPTNKGLFQISIKDLVQYAKLKTGIIHKSNEDNSAGSQPAELFYRYHSREEGFNTNEFNGGCEPCGLKLPNGYISLPSLNGFVWFRPETIKDYKSDGSIILDRVEVNQKPVAVSNDTVRFPRNPELVKLSFSTAYFGNKYNLKVSYALMDENEKRISTWIPVDRENIDVEFSNLHSGNYTLIVRKLTGLGVNNYILKKVYFIVPLFWYETWWAIVLFVFLLFAIAYSYSIFRIRKIRQEKGKLEEIVERRTNRLNHAMIDLETSKDDMSRQLHMLSRLLASMTHDIQSPLNYINLTSSNISRMIGQGKFEEVAELGELIADSSQRMSNLLKGLLNYIKVHVYENALCLEHIDLKILVDEKFGIFKNMVALNNSWFVNEIPDDIQVLSDHQMLGIMIHNLIDNAAKYTSGGQIKVYISNYSENKLVLVVANSSTGIPQQVQDMINTVEIEGALDLSKSGYRKTSLGLLIVKEIAALLGIGLKVEQTDMTSFYMIFKKSI
ncbi:sensor histidine kinase [Dyadobacter frigoris]|uniref:histidine kinase n=1 Tax=Dyadobacter frigoris TaxID=2576211 RepID=A0A4U6CVK5_9BACT|nr:HAMP domain-containing sensor histidine kinase [Dyadobacter frigoris]TKT88799.1 hypothetical protein FDK13_26225 [Dyadobacter frigoris]GLU53996.1 hypothetical protein Dfri01_34570 [Dyadobacter frigoris]